jgi:glycosyltransferase involved in cell wall biosynthesis
MRVGIDGSTIRSGGAITHLAECLAALQPKDFLIEQVTVWGARRLLERLPVRPWLRASPAQALEGSLPKRILWQQVKLRTLLRRNCDVVYDPAGIHLGVGLPFVSFAQYLLPFDPENCARYGFFGGRLRLELLRRIQLHTFARADGVIFLSEETRRCVTTCAIRQPRRYRVVYHGVSHQFRQTPRQARPWTAITEKDPLKLLYISSLTQYKEQLLLIEAVASLRAARVPVRLELVGEALGGYKAEVIEAMRRADPTGSFIVYSGQIPHEEMPALYAGADMFVFPSTCEAFGMGVLEAMSAGLPVICARRTSFPEVAGDAVLYFDPGEPGSLAESIALLARDAGLRERLAWSGFKRAELFSWRKCAEETFGFLREVLDEAGRNREKSA